MPKFKQTMNGNLRYKVEPEYMLSQFELNQLHAMPVDNLLDISAEKNKEFVYSIYFIKHHYLKTYSFGNA